MPPLIAGISRIGHQAANRANTDEESEILIKKKEKLVLNKRRNAKSTAARANRKPLDGAAATLMRARPFALLSRSPSSGRRRDARRANCCVRRVNTRAIPRADMASTLCAERVWPGVCCA